MKHLGTNIEDLDIATRELVATQVGELSSEVATKADQTALESAVDRIASLEGLTPIVEPSSNSGIEVGTITIGDETKTFYAPTPPSLDGYALQSWVTDQGYITDVVSALGYTPFNNASFTKNNIKNTLGIYNWALATSKPSYKFSELDDTPTTLSGYGILNDAKSKFLSLSEGAVILAIAENALAKDSFDRIYADAIDANTISAEMLYTNTINGNTPITSGNIGDQSVNYATSAGKATQLATSRTIWGRSFNGTGDISGAIEGATTGSFSSNVTIGGTLSVTGAVALSSTLAITGATTFTGNTTNKAIAYFAGGTTYYVDASGAAKFASLTSVGAISGASGSFSGTLTVSDVANFYDTVNFSSAALFNNGNYYINASGVAKFASLTSVGLLTANGGITIPSGESLTIGGAVLSWDSSASALKITSSVYSNGTVSALGVGEAGSGGGGGDTYWAIADDSSLAPVVDNINVNRIQGPYNDEDGRSELYVGDADDNAFVYMSSIASQDGTTYWLIEQDGDAKFRKISASSGTLAITGATYNGYTLGAACAKSVTTSVTSGSTALVTSGAVYTAIQNAGGGGGSVTNINGSKILRCESLDEVITYLESESNDMGGYFIVEVSRDINLGDYIASLTNVASLQSGVVIEFVKMSAYDIVVPPFSSSGIRLINTSFSSPTVSGGIINGSIAITFSNLAGFKMVYNSSTWDINITL